MCGFEAKRGRRERESQRTSSMAGMLFTPRRFSVFCRRLSSVVVVLCTIFFFRRAEPLPPVRAPPCNKPTRTRGGGGGGETQVRRR